jgi:hypothetical protein
MRGGPFWLLLGLVSTAIVGGSWKTITALPVLPQPSVVSNHNPSPPSGNGPAAPTQTKVDFSDNQPLVLNQASGDNFTATVFIRNDMPADENVAFSCVVLDDDGKPVTVRTDSSPSKLPANAMTAVRLQLTVSQDKVPLSGYLKLETQSGTPESRAYKYRQLKIVQPLPSEKASCLVLTAMGISVGLFLFSLIRLKVKDVRIWGRMGTATWSFGDSWGSNIGVGAAFLSALLGFSAFPEQTVFLNKTAYISLSLVFSGLIILAPAVYNLIRSPALDATSGSIKYEGYVLFFVLASALTVWGALGQLATAGFVVEELFHARAFPHSTMVSFLVVLGIVSIMLLYYAWSTIFSTAKIQTAIRRFPEEAEAKRRRKDEFLLKLINEEKALPEWHLL